MKLVDTAVIGLVCCLSSVALAEPPVGTWLSQDGGTKVHIVACGGKLCGTVVWLDKPTANRQAKDRKA